LKSTDSAATFTFISNALFSFNVTALAIDPKTPSNLYAGSAVQRSFVTKFSPTGVPLYSTYLGGSANEFAGGIAADPLGNVYVTGVTQSRDFPVKNAFRTAIPFGFDAYVAQLNPTGSALVFSTYLGGSAGFSEGLGVAADSSGAYVVGITAASNFPTLTPLQPAIGGSVSSFVTKFNSAGALAYSTFLGGSAGFDAASGIAVDGAGDAWVT